MGKNNTRRGIRRELQRAIGNLAWGRKHVMLASRTLFNGNHFDLSEELGEIDRGMSEMQEMIQDFIDRYLSMRGRQR